MGALDDLWTMKGLDESIEKLCGFKTSFITKGLGLAVDCWVKADNNDDMA